MKYKKMFIVLIPIILIIAACPTGTLPGAESGTTPVYSLSFSGAVTINTATGTLDFGIVEAESTGSEATGTIKNTGDTAFTVTDISLDDSVNYSLTTPTLPYKVEPGKTTSFTLAFIPQSSGVKPAKLKIINTPDTDLPVEMDVTGEGNYAPTAQFGIDVSGSVAYPDVNGFYVKDGTFNNHPTYKKSGTTPYYIYFYLSDGYFWEIDSDVNTNYPANTGGSLGFIGALSPANIYYPPEYELASGLNWVENSADAPPITVTTGITRVIGTDVLTANYYYSDTEVDTESGTTFKWYMSSAADGTYTKIPETSSEYVVPSEYLGYYFKVEVTPVDANGFTGSPVTSDPYYVEPPSQQP